MAVGWSGNGRLSYSPTMNARTRALVGFDNSFLDRPLGYRIVKVAGGARVCRN